MATLDNLTFNNIATIDVTPPLSVDNYDVKTSNIPQQYINTTAQAISRFVNGLFLIQQSFKQTMHLPETPGLMQLAIQNNLLTPLSKVYPEFNDFQFEITNSGSIIGKNDVANTILHAICAVAKAPVHDNVVDGKDEHANVLHLTDDIFNEDEDDEYDDEKFIDEFGN